MVQSLDDARRRSRSGAGATGRVPPHNLQAEESLLGAMLLSRDAIASAVETCGVNDFYKPAHGHVFDAICSLYAQGEPADPVTVADELRRADLLEAIGGPGLLITLQANTPATANAQRYARIVEEHALLRRLIGVAGEIAEIGYGMPDDVAQAVDRAESMVFEVAERRVTDSLRPLHDLLSDSLDRLEALYERGEAITGVPTGFLDLDERLSGLQPSNLLIVGARPSMGKALSLDTRLPTPAGWTTMGDVRVGDAILDERGAACSVTYVTPVMKDRRCYRVTFDDGSHLVADADHQWLAGEANREPHVVTTQQMLDRGVRSGGARRPNWYIRLADALVLPDKALATDPYLLGVSLARGIPMTAKVGAAVGHGTRPNADLSSPIGQPAMRIPPAYLRSSRQQRRALLQGFVDTVGKVRHAAIQLCLADPELLAEVRELVCSLGFKAGPISRRPMDRCDHTSFGWQFAWSHTHGRHTRRAIVSIEPCASVPVRCLTVDSPNHLYLAGTSMIPTHNTALALGMAAHAAMEARTPVLFFSLEMSHSEVTQRLLCSEARVDSSRVRNGKLLESDWPKISHAIGRLGEAPLFIDDNPNLTVMEIRAKARRLRSQRGELGLIIVDYLQLMTGRHSAENRQVEVSEISRGLKILARELEVPVVALSQLSRNLESRADKRPVLADLRESGCLTASTTVLRSDNGAAVSLGELLLSGEQDIPVWTLDDSLHMVPGVMSHVFPTGVKPVFMLQLASGRRVDASANHPFLTLDGWTRVEELAVGSCVAVPRRVPAPALLVRWPEAGVVALARMLAEGSGCHQDGCFGLSGLPLADRFIPREVFSLPDDQAALFLGQLWRDNASPGVRADDSTVAYWSPSRAVIDGLQTLLLRFEIQSCVAAVAEPRQAGYRLNIVGGANQRTFARLVSVHGTGDRRGAASLPAGDAEEDDAAADSLPAEIWRRVPESVGISRRAPSRSELAQVADVLGDDNLRRIAQADIAWDRVTAIIPRGPQPVYDATVPGTHNFVANGITVENSLEQDADVVMFLYRDEVYNPESPDRGTAEIIVSKHRNGPTGITQLAFLDHYTRFANMARV